MPRIQHKRGTSANLASANPTPLAGELVWDSSENAIKIGDGATAWTSLAYVTATPRSHKSQHATGGSDALTPSDIGAAPAASPTFTGTVTVSGVRPLTLYGDANDAAVKRGGTGGWAFAYAAEGSSGTNRGGYGFFGTADALTYYWIGSAFNTATVYVTTTGVGIGSSRTSPSSALDVNGVITVSATAGSAGSYAPSVTFSGDANTGFGQVSGQSDSASIFTAGHERVRVDSSGRVGIGNTSMSSFNANFDDLVVGSGGAQAGITLFSTTQGSLVFGDTATTGVDGYRGYVSYLHSSDALIFGSLGTERMRIRSDGNVAIGSVGYATARQSIGGSIAQSGTAMPANLFVHSSMSADSGQATKSAWSIWSAATPAASQAFTNFGHFYVSQGIAATGSDTTNHYGFFANVAGAANNIAFYAGCSNLSGYWNFYAGTLAPNYFAGNVGIGASRTTPGSALDVNGVITVAAGTAAAPALVFSGDSNTGIAQVGGADSVSLITAGSERMRVRSDGNVGLGGSGSGNVGLFHQYTMSSASTRYGDLVQPTISAASTSNVVLFAAQSIMAASATSSNVTGYEALGASMGASAAITNQRGFVVGASFTQGTNNYAFSSSVPAGATRWNIYADGTAQNHFAGNVGIGSGNTAPAAPLHVVGETRLIGPIVEGRVAGGNTGTAKTIALTNGTLQDYTLTGNCTFTLPNASVGLSFTLMLRTGTGGFTATFTGASTIRWPGGVTPTATTAAGKLDIFTFVSDGGKWYGAYQQNYTD